ncbi:pali-domain-containing protein [Macrolepiota fuliginosa MF-IS2]|uniref:Pali-domain-containing protein n=1 Tax=Macrolepiota fuliginosa MF-IS2 TaxID=1400762 RepID=A0A9P6C489_9AGAR|nr:pali-domain-containing protein [Macrolepiota fuliginosa MF-IS2]
MPASPAIPGLFLCFAATVLLVFVSVSSPTWEAISFLNVGVGSTQIHYGVFGFTGSTHSIGYLFSNDRLNSTVLHNLTKTLILHPIAGGLAGIAFLFGLCGTTARTRVGTVFMALVAGLATLATFVAWVIDMILFGIARQRFREAGQPAQYGNANWLTLGALIALLLGFCASACGVFGRYGKRRNAY